MNVENQHKVEIFFFKKNIIILRIEEEILPLQQFS